MRSKTFHQIWNTVYYLFSIRIIGFGDIRAFRADRHTTEINHVHCVCMLNVGLLSKSLDVYLLLYLYYDH